MDDLVIDTHLENIDRRLTNVEQILPTLATTADLQAAVALLATKTELEAAIEPLATKAELRAAVAPLATKNEFHELRRHMDVIGEALRADIQLLAEHVASLRPGSRND
ncbi:MAG TPA: hypothetical protein VGI97_06410 [Gemmatimonadaceae bacterium]|jgi:hypothetical protein